MKYKEKIQQNYEFNRDIVGIEFDSKLEYIGHTIFYFTTYDSELDSILGAKALDVLEVILHKDNWEYIEYKDNYLNFIAMLNTPILNSLVEWGTSIRSCWLDNHVEHLFDCDRLKVDKGELTIFVKELLEWVND